VGGVTPYWRRPLLVTDRLQLRVRHGLPGVPRLRREAGVVLLERPSGPPADQEDWLKRLPKSPVAIHFFDGQQSLDAFYVLWAHERSGLSRLLECIGSAR